jgi:hypothetical protein
MVEGKQHTITWHVDDVKSSHVNKRVNNEFLQRLNNYRSYTGLSCHDSGFFNPRYAENRLEKLHFSNDAEFPLKLMQKVHVRKIYFRLMITQRN